MWRSGEERHQVEGQVLKHVEKREPSYTVGGNAN